ncbi:uncharacterized protein LOC132264775 isoform X4 [Phlebotomus argentipes]|uniref:uncharacterized protein LOC132264775 isoform X4 n=1 Tax=Phlebotomus argentipes TaxID=94469 RepID=UPI002893168A|nr:uncharacterized protein LOC132264775 isoform X4 [Phlebotomus argentipes]
MTDLSDASKLPPGWDEKYDPNSGLYFYINYITKTTTFDDPRIKHRQSVSTGTGTNYGNSTESIPMQPLHGSPYHVYPANNYPAVQPAFQGPASGVHSHSASPLLAAKIQQMEMSPVTRPATPRTNAHFSRSNIQETSFSNSAMDTEASVAKINTMFPTVSDTHIRLLLKKYLKSIYPKAEETLLLDILANADNNVQKASEELTQMGYEKKDTTIPKVSMRKKDEAKNEIKNRIDRATPPQLPPKLKTSEEKAKLKVRLQSQYKDIPEKIIAMALESVDYSEDKALAILNIVVQEDDKNAKATENTPAKVEKKVAEVQATSSAPSRSSSTSSAKRHGEISNKISVAQEQECESVDAPPAPSSSSTAASPSTKEASSDDVPAVEEIGSAKRRQARSKAKNDHTKAVETQEEPDVAKKTDFKSLTPRTVTSGPNSTLSKGPNDELLLVDYVTWNGANPDLATGRKQVALGSDPKNRSERSYVPKGANAELCKGPRPGLAKGSIYSQLTKGIPAGASVICN